MRWFEICESYLVEDRIDFLRNQFKDVPENDFNQIVESDPTKNKIYTQWLLNLYKKNQLSDLSNVSKYLSVFDRWKHKLDKKDINQYHNLDELIQAIDPHDNKTNELRQRYNIKDSDFDQIVKADPTENKIYVKWLLDIYSKDKRLIEDLPKATRYLKVFDKKKNILGTNITDYDDLPDLYQKAIEPFDKRKDTTKQWDDSINKEIKIVYKSPEGQILIPQTKEASIYLGQGTQWCTAFTNDKNRFDYYNQKGPLYCIFTNDNRKYQFHLQTGQLKDEIDRDVNFDEFNEKYPWVFDHIKFKDDYLIKLIQKEPYLFRYIKNPSNEIKNALLKKLKLSSDFFTSEKVQLSAVNNDGRIIYYINNPSEEVKLAAVTQNGWVIQHIKNPSEEVQLAAINQNNESIEFIKNPSEEVQLAAVNEDGWAIRYIKNPSEEVQLAAVNQHGWAIQFIKNPSEEVQLAAINQNSDAIQFIQNPSEEVQLAAINQDGFAIKYIKNPTPKAIELAKSLGD